LKPEEAILANHLETVPDVRDAISSMEAIFYEIFEALPRQGPGDERSTKRASQKLIELPEHPEILDVGCGTGGQTLALAKLSTGNITALDNYAPFIEKLKCNARRAGYAERIHCVVGDMAAMNFPKGSFDVIWCEGAAFVMGFDNALKSWGAFLRPKGYLAVSELVWFKKRAPQEIEDFFTREYPDMKYYEHIFPIIESAGYKMVDYFQLPGESWWTHYYTPMEKKLAEMRRKYKGNKKAQAIFDSLQLEIDMHRKYSDYYGYGFFIMKRLANE
jgi:ubiquinone/menaquinone biosynthesis C-methylase UbiE